MLLPILLGTQTLPQGEKLTQGLILTGHVYKMDTFKLNKKCSDKSRYTDCSISDASDSIEVNNHAKI